MRRTITMKNLLILLLFQSKYWLGSSSPVWEKYGSAEQQKYASSKWYDGLGMAISRDGRYLAVTEETLKVFKIGSTTTGDGEWVQIGNDIPLSKTKNVRIAVADNASRVVIGEGSVDGVNGLQSGRVRVMAFDGGAWYQVGRSIDGKAARDKFGDSVSISADGAKIAIGAWKNKGNEGTSDTVERQGEVRVYEFDNFSWVEMGQEVYTSNKNGRRFGWDVDLSAKGSRIVVGSPLSGSDSSWNGRVSVYDFQDKSWVQVGQRLGGSENSRFGSSVAISADSSTIVIGAPFAKVTTDRFTDSRGMVRAYRFDGSSWEQMGQDIVGGGLNVAVSANGLRVAVGERGDTFATVDDPRRSSRAKIYDLVNGTKWVQVGEDFQGWGGSISMSADGSRIAMAYFDGIDYFRAHTFRDTQYASSPNAPVYAYCVKVDQQWCLPPTTGDFSTHYMTCSGQENSLTEFKMPVAPGTQCCSDPLSPDKIMLQHANVKC